jgi:poly-gamma-glutamate synthesis protein (capsule biosynthesis protein)
MKKIFKNCDLVVGNLETVLHDDPLEGFPHFSCSPKLANALKRAGFDVLITCNNHSLDQGEEGVKQTHESVVAAGIVPIGSMQNFRQSFDIKGIKLTIHAWTTFMNEDKTSKDVSLWKESQVELQPGHNIAYIHSGKEYSTKETPEQAKIEKFLKESGFDGVIFSHSHLPAPVKFSDGFFVTHGMGNFISDQEKLEVERGNCLLVTMSAKKIDRVETIITESVVKDSGETQVKRAK